MSIYISYVYMYTFICVCVCICVYVYKCVYICLCIYICVCVYIYIYVHISLYMYVCMRTPVNVIEGPYHPLRFGRRGCCFYKSENAESDVYTASPYGLVDLQLPHRFDMRFIFISLCLSLWCIFHKWYSHAPQPCAPTVDHQPTTKSRFQQVCFLFFTNNYHPDVKLYYNRFILSDSERTRIEHKRKGHLRHGHQQLVHTSQRDHKPTTHKWMYYPHTSIEILSRFF